MKVLLIDHLSPRGHLKYAQFWVDTLNKLGIDYDIVAKKNFLDNLENIRKKIEIPDEIYVNIENKNILIRELALLKVLKYIKKNIDLTKYEKIVFLSFENISLFLTPIFHKSNIYLILHNNLRRINERITYYIIKYLSKKNTLICLDYFIKAKLKLLNIKTKLVVHPIFKIKEEKKYEKKEIVIFSPSIESVDEELLKKIFEDTKIKDILKHKNIKLILRSKKMKFHSEYLDIVNEYLEKESYNRYLQKADIVFLPYKKDFNLRISGVLLESFYLKKSLIIPKYNDLKYFLQFKEEGIVGFNDTDDLIVIFKNIEILLKNNKYQQILSKYSIRNAEENIQKIILKEIKN